MKNTFFQQNGVSGQKRYFLKLIVSCQLNQTYRFIMLDQKCYFFFIKTTFWPVLTGKAFKHCMFDLRFQIDLYDQNLALKKGF